jgi:ribonuclease HI
MTVDNEMEAPLEPLGDVTEEVVQEESSDFKDGSTTLATVDNEMEAPLEPLGDATEEVVQEESLDFKDESTTLATVDNEMEAPLEPLHLAQEAVQEESSDLKEESMTMMTVDNEMKAPLEPLGDATEEVVQEASSDFKDESTTLATVDNEVEAPLEPLGDATVEVLQEESSDFKDESTTLATVDNEIEAPLEIDLVIRFDGGSRGNPGIGGAGAVIHCTWSPRGNDEVYGKEVCLRKYLRQKVTCNQAEYQGVIRGLEETVKLVRGFQEQCDVNDREHCQVRLLIQGDSKLVINQLSGDWNCKSANMKPLLAKAQRLLSDLDKVSMAVVTFGHIYRKFNAVADGMHLSILYRIDDFLLMPIDLIFIFLFLV